VNTDNSAQPIIAGILGVCVGAGLVYFFLETFATSQPVHPIANPFDTEYHVHADFQIFVRDQQIDLTGDVFMTTNQQTVHKHAHLHDGNGEVKHIHSEDLTFANFLQSLAITLTDSCLTLFAGETLCLDEKQALLLYVNQELYTEPLTQYVPVDNDRVLLYYGNPQNENIQTYLEKIPSDACYYSGTCPERGTAPPESCGLTCEL
jgi:hypothetical protein